MLMQNYGEALTTCDGGVIGQADIPQMRGHEDNPRAMVVPVSFLNRDRSSGSLVGFIVIRLAYLR